MDDQSIPMQDNEIRLKNELLQNLLMELVVQLNKETISILDFRCFMKYFKKDSNLPNNSVKVLLKSLNRIVYQTSSSTLEPSSYLKFTNHHTKSSAILEDSGYTVNAAITASEDEAHATAMDQTQEHEDSLTSAWKVSALTFKLSYSTAEPMFSLHTKSDVTISTWIYWDFSKLSNLNEVPKFHIFSVGSKSLLLECWIDAMTIQARVTSSVSTNAQQIDGKATFHLADFFPSSKNDASKRYEFKQWTHLLLTCATKADKSAAIQLFVNTIPSKTLLINLKSIYAQLQQQAKKIDPEATRQTLMIGHHADAQSRAEDTYSHYRIGTSCMVLHSVIREPSYVASLYFLGPSCTTLTSSLVPVPNQMCNALMKRGFKDCPKYAHQILTSFKEVHEAQSSDDFQTFQNTLQIIRRELRILFCVDNPDQALFYPPHVKEEGGGSLLSSLYMSLGGPSSINNQELGEAPCQETPIPICNSNDVMVKPITPKKFAGVMMQEGGTCIMLLLLARVVELTSATNTAVWDPTKCGDGDLEIGLALDILFKAISSSSEATEDFHSKDGFLLLKRIFSYEHCTAGKQTIKVMFKHCISSQEEFSFHMDPGEETSETGKYFYDINILRLVLFDCWSLWNKNLTSTVPKGDESSCIWKVIHICAAALKEDNEFRSLNVKTLKSLDLTKRFAYLIKSNGVLHKNVGTIIAELMSQLLESPPSIKDLKTLADAVLLLHESNLTYVAHAKLNFFFMVGEKSKGKRRRKSETHVHQEPRQQSLDEFNQQSSKETNSEPAEAIDTKREVQNICFGVLQNNEVAVDRRRDAKENIPEEDYFSPDQDMEEIIETRSMDDGRNDISKVFSADEDDSTATDSVVSEMDLDTDCDMHKHLLEHPGKWGVSKTKGIKEDAEEEDSHEINCVMKGVLDYLVNALQNLPDDMVKDAVSQVLTPEFILVITNHPNEEIRSVAVRLMREYIQRTHGTLEVHGHRLLKLEGYLLLANQLHQYKATENLVNTCLSIFHGRPMLLYDGQEIQANIKSSSVRTPGLVPLLALLPKSLNDVALAHSLIVHLHELCAKVPGLLRNHKSIGLLEALCKTLAALAHLNKQTTDVCGQDSREILFTDLNDFFRLIGLRFVTAHGLENWKTIEEFMKLLVFMSIEDNCSEGTGAFRSSVCTLLEECLADVQNRVSQIDMYSMKRKALASGTSTLLGLGGFGSIYGNATNAKADGNVFSGEEVTDIFLQIPVTPRDSISEPGNHSPRQRRRHKTGETDGITFSTTKSGHLNGVSSWMTKNPDNVKLATRPELVERFAHLIDFAVDFFLHIDSSSPRYTGPTQIEEDLIFNIISLLLDEVKAVLSVATAAKEDVKITTLKGLYVNKQTLKNKLLSLINFCLSAAMPHRIRLKIIRILYYEESSEDIIKHLLKHNTSHGYLFCNFLEHFVHLSKTSEELSDIEQNETVEFYTKLKECAILEDSSDIEEAGVGETADKTAVIEMFLRQVKSSTRKFNKNCVNQVLKTIQEQYDDLILVVTSKAMEVTQVVMKLQDEERKKMMVIVKNELSENVKATQLWHHLIEQYTHERAMWYVPTMSARSWKLSEAEGANRMRIRLNRTFTDIHSKHYKDEFKAKGKDMRKDVPFSYLLATLSGMSSVIIAQLSANDRIRHMEQCTLILPATAIAGEILVSDSTIYFVESSRDAHQQLAESLISFSIDISSILEVHLRWYQLIDCGLELFLVGGTTKMFAFIDSKQRNEFVTNVSKLGPLSPTKLIPLEKITKKWLDGDLTNFDYLMQLNKHAGRTFNDLMQYPTFPFVLSDYEATKIDFRNPKIFRDLSKPISIQDSTKENQYKENYSALESELVQSQKASCGPGMGPYHYGSHYSNSGIVLHFLARLPPFTEMFLSYQDGNFDLPDRMFHKMATSWYLASQGSSTDVKELIPELYYLPEIFTNGEGLDLGRRQNGDPVDDVVLPEYCENDARLFVKIHRQALDSDYVRENLNYWIDLIFGYKQKGEAALGAINVFHPATYYGFDLDSVKDPVQREARATMIKMYGQTPKHLFAVPHPKASKHSKGRELSAEDAGMKRVPWSRGSPKSSSEDISAPIQSIPKVLDSVDGLSWGCYIGKYFLYLAYQVKTISRF